MKKVLAILLVLVMMLSMTACGEKERYPEIADLLDAGDYEGAVQKIVEMYQASLENGGNNNNGNNNSGNNGGAETQPTTKPVEPTEEEWELLRTYRNILQNLNNSLEYGISIWIDDVYYEGTFALEYYYNRLQEMTGVDKWVGTEFVTENYISNADEVNWDRQAVLNAFTILQDVVLKHTRSSIDNMGNKNSPSDMGRYTYNADGILVSMYDGRYDGMIRPWSSGGTRFIEYDAAGRIIQVKYGSTDRVDRLVTYTYDDANHTVNEHVKTNSGEWDYLYTYDADGKLLRIDWADSEDYWYDILYTYDDSGKLLKEEKTYYTVRSYNDSDHVLVNDKWIKEYNYTGNVLTTGTYTEEDWSWSSNYLGNGQYEYTNYVFTQRIDQYTYTCDAQGRVVKEDIVPGDEMYLAGDNAGQVYDEPDYQSVTCETIYGNYYIYAPQQ